MAFGKRSPFRFCSSLPTVQCTTVSPRVPLLQLWSAASHWSPYRDNDHSADGWAPKQRPQGLLLTLELQFGKPLPSYFLSTWNSQANDVTRSLNKNPEIRLNIGLSHEHWTRSQMLSPLEWCSKMGHMVPVHFFILVLSSVGMLCIRTDLTVLMNCEGWRSQNQTLF